MRMEVTSALLVTVTVEAAESLTVAIGKNGGKIMTERWCRKQLSVTGQGFHRCTPGIRRVLVGLLAVVVNGLRW